MKTLTDIFETEDFIDFYQKATKAELRDRLKTLKSKQQNLKRVRNETLAIKTLLA